MVDVAPGVHLETLDWGGSGSPLVMIPGLGVAASSFDGIAQKLAKTHHVYGITRRGVGNSSVPVPDATNYSATQLGDDILQVMNTLQIQKPVLIGHSFGGEELSSIGSRHPERVAALVYLDAAYAYAFYDATHGDLLIDSLALQKTLGQLVPGRGPLDQRQLLQQLAAAMTQLQQEIGQREIELRDQPPPPDASKMPPFPPQFSAMFAGQQRFTGVQVPVLAIFAVPHGAEPGRPKLD